MVTSLIYALQAAAPAEPPKGGGMSMWIMLIAVFAIMYIFMIYFSYSHLHIISL